jgi:hypothetical protein
MEDPRLREAKRADSWQSAKALLIPFSLFVACIVCAAGTFLVYHEEPLGYVFLTFGGVTIVAAFVGFIRFQNQYRARGIMGDSPKSDGDQIELDQQVEADKLFCDSAGVNSLDRHSVVSRNK